MDKNWLAARVTMMLLVGCDSGVILRQVQNGDVDFCQESDKLDIIHIKKKFCTSNSIFFDIG